MASINTTTTNNSMASTQASQDHIMALINTTTATGINSMASIPDHAACSKPKKLILKVRPRAKLTIKLSPRKLAYLEQEAIQFQQQEESPSEEKFTIKLSPRKEKCVNKLSPRKKCTIKLSPRKKFFIKLSPRKEKVAIKAEEVEIKREDETPCKRFTVKLSLRREVGIVHKEDVEY
ncbi:unnamed protein product [Zymoseptoria tritici ST99CH_1E4]|uniref:Uncharacterized protein n=1 Tax=Zymoseptoria tritici ST99CH_1E4 TaxID=1276532 RepID=A0A2H1GUC6_ZYMTR|nr:unnamed protein product [Zymoseptoria tritici ST99CH_1E4]